MESLPFCTLGNVRGGAGLRRKDCESSLQHDMLEMTEGHLNLHAQKEVGDFSPVDFEHRRYVQHM